MKIIHPLEPIFNKDSKVLILGTMPSIKSRELGFYYMHPQNRFWSVLEIVFNEKIPNDIESKTNFLLTHHIALWDTIKSCTITDSKDSSIKNVKVNNIKKLIKNTNIKYIFTTGKKSYELYNKYIYPQTTIPAILLYSPSPANCAISLASLVENYQIIKHKSQE